jgi:hypothetical protein
MDCGYAINPRPCVGIAGNALEVLERLDAMLGQSDSGAST